LSDRDTALAAALLLARLNADAEAPWSGMGPNGLAILDRNIRLGACDG
jgi:hypothetical protein